METEALRSVPGGQMQLDCGFADLFVRYIPPCVLELLPTYVVRAARTVPVALEGDVLVVAMEDPDDFDLQDKIRYIADRELRIAAATSAAVDFAIETYYARMDV